MKALTISQPWATRIARREKFIENRGWSPRYRGLLAIHAGSGTHYMTRQQLRDKRAEYPTGCVIAIGKLLEVKSLVWLEYQREMKKGSQRIAGFKTIDEILDHEYTEGEECWILANVVQLPEPIEAKGERGLWDWECPDALAAWYEREVSRTAQELIGR